MMDRLNRGRIIHQFLNSFNRWPTWMWANKEMIEFIEWLKEYNDTILSRQRLSTSLDKQVEFYGLDLAQPL